MKLLCVKKLPKSTPKTPKLHVRPLYLTGRNSKEESEVRDRDKNPTDNESKSDSSSDKVKAHSKSNSDIVGKGLKPETHEDDTEIQIAGRCLDVPQQTVRA